MNFAKSQNQAQGDLLSTVNEVFKTKIIKGLKGVENIYTQHTPVIKDTIEDLVKGRLKPNYYPFLTRDRLQYVDKPQGVIVFMIGGVTYEESLHIHQLNQSLPGVRIILGGTSIHNFSSFLEELSYANQKSILS